MRATKEILVSGFIYIWFDKKHHRFYVGSHWGSEDDGYICSSTWMRNAYKRRPADFKRRIIAKVDSSRNDLLIEEHRWLQMIKKDELGKKFYNLTNHLNGHWFASDEDRVLSLKEKISKKTKEAMQRPEVREKYEAGLKTRKVDQSEETREKRRQSMKGKNVGVPKTQAFYDSRAAWRGRKLPESTIAKIKESSQFKTLNTKKVKCQYCDAVQNVGNISRYHNERCKQRVHKLLLPQP